MSDVASEVLPLGAEPGFRRDIKIESCRLDEEHIQVRGQLTDTRADYEDASKALQVHCMVARLTIRLSDNVITDAQFGLPKMAFQAMCEKLPTGADALIGVNARDGFSAKLRSIFGSTKSCFHLSSLMQAMVPVMPQCRLWNTEFKYIDEKLPPEAVPRAMAKMQSRVIDSCHAWAAEEGGITADFKNGNYEPMLDRVSPRLLKRWRQHSQDQDG